MTKNKKRMRGMMTQLFLYVFFLPACKVKGEEGVAALRDRQGLS